MTTALLPTAPTPKNPPSGLEAAFIIRKIKEFRSRRNIPGFEGNFQFFAHNGKVETPDDGYYRSVGDFENSMVRQLCRHLFLNNVRPRQISVLTNSKSRQHQISTGKKSLPEIYRGVQTFHIDDEVLYRYQTEVFLVNLCETGDGDEDQLKFVKCVTEALKMAKTGVIIISSVRVLRFVPSSPWHEVVRLFESHSLLRPYLALYCETHGRLSQNCKSGEDIQRLAPLGGCDKFPGIIMACGHPTETVCEPQQQQAAKKCVFPCPLKCPQGHPCLKLCHEICLCSENCAFFHESCGHLRQHKGSCVVPCTFMFPCGHACNKACFICSRKGHSEGIKCFKTCEKMCAAGKHPCQRHPCTEQCPPCNIPVVEKLHCGHKTSRPCSEPGIDLDTWFCEEICGKKFPFCNHTCNKKCGEDCGICEVKYNRVHPGCRHYVPSICGQPIIGECKHLVRPRVASFCGHDIWVFCSKRDTMTSESMARQCTMKCRVTLQCGHICHGSCVKCHQGRFHQRCFYECDKVLFCGHRCQTPCPLVCPPCKGRCMAICEHQACPYECGVPCDLKCESKCPYECPHLKCGKLCGEVCDRVGCVEPCPKLLSCGHPCIGFCGEPCPPICRERCKPGTLIDFLEEDEPPVKRYINIPSCGHIVEEKSLASWLQISSREILLKSCPQCRLPLPLTMRRFSKAILPMWMDVQKVKRRLVGETAAIEEGLGQIRDQVKGLLDGEDESGVFVQFGEWLWGECEKPLRVERKSGVIVFQSAYMEKVAFLEFILKRWIAAKDSLETADILWEPTYVDRYHKCLTRLFDWVFERAPTGWPLHPNEVADFHTELLRINDLKNLYDRLSFERDEKELLLGQSFEAKTRFAAAEKLLLEWRPYNDELRNRFLTELKEFSAIQKYTLQLTEEERAGIVRAFGFSSGRWFKCPNGHPYVVTECGGVTEIGVCNECGSGIGGENHQVMMGNQLAPEVDGADGPLYPTALMRN